METEGPCWPRTEGRITARHGTQPGAGMVCGQQPAAGGIACGRLHFCAGVSVVTTRKPKPRIPKTREEWQEAVDAAHALLCLDSARLYGLITGGPTVNVDRCARILEAGKKLKVQPSPYAVERMVAALMQEPAHA